VALLALQICIAKGANVYVTGGSQEKINFAINLGAKDGVLYRDGLFIFRALLTLCLMQSQKTGPLS
jgi:hypothetical protein